MAVFVAVPTPNDVEGELKQIVKDLDRWQGLSLRALRALPSVRFWEPPPEARARYEGQPARTLSNAAVRQRLEEAILRTVLSSDREALSSLFALHRPKGSLTERRKDAAEHRGIDHESFRTSTERKLIRELAEEMFRGELEWAEHELETLRPARSPK